jgi:hypothetical protein
MSSLEPRNHELLRILREVGDNEEAGYYAGVIWIACDCFLVNTTIYASRLALRGNPSKHPTPDDIRHLLRCYGLRSKPQKKWGSKLVIPVSMRNGQWKIWFDPNHRLRWNCTEKDADLIPYRKPVPKRTRRAIPPIFGADELELIGHEISQTQLIEPQLEGVAVNAENATDLMEALTREYMPPRGPPTLFSGMTDTELVSEEEKVAAFFEEGAIYRSPHSPSDIIFPNFIHNDYL